MRITKDTLAAADGTSSIAQATVFSGTAKAWSNLNGTTFGERDSFNFSGFVDNGTGDYSHTISADMSDANYSVKATAGHLTINQSSVCHPTTTYPDTATAFRLQTLTGHVSVYDTLTLTTSAHGDLA